MPNDFIEIGDIVFVRGDAGVYKVMQTRNTVGIARPEDELRLHDEDGNGIDKWEKRANLYLFQKRKRKQPLDVPVFLQGGNDPEETLVEQEPSEGMESMYVYVELNEYEKVISYTLIKGRWPLPVPNIGDDITSDGQRFKVNSRTFRYGLNDSGEDMLTINLDVTLHED